MNEHLTREILDRHFHYFTFSLFRFKDIYLPLMFANPESSERHVAYLCPLCVSNYIILLQRGLFSTTEFSLDHFPPESVGGSWKLLTCKKCNNEAGSSYEGELIKKMNYEAVGVNMSEAQYKIRTQIAGVEGSYTSSLKKIREGLFEVDFPKKLKRRAVLLNDWINTPNRGHDWEIKITIQKPDDKKVALAVLKAAYLMSFYNWGYDFAFSTNAEILRGCMGDNDQASVNLVPFWIDTKNPQKDELPIGLCIIEKPAEMKTYVVNVPMKVAGYSTIATVLIPHAGDKGWERIKAINEFLKYNPTVTITFKGVVSPMASKIFDGYSQTNEEYEKKD